MTAARFYRLALSLWGEEWRSELRKLLARHGHTFTDYSSHNLMWEWKTGKRKVPGYVA